MSLIIFESNNLDGLRPFSFNHSPIELRVGAFTNLERLQCLYKDEDIIQELYDSLFHIQHRGQDSFGMYTYRHKDKRYSHIKQEGLLANNISIQEQIDKFSEAEVIVSATSSSLTNIIFCSQGTTIIEITPKYQFEYENNLRLRYSYICNLLNSLRRGLQLSGDRPISS